MSVLRVSQKRTCNETNCSERKRKALTIEEKIRIIKRFERMERTCDIARSTGLRESTLRSIRDNSERIKESFSTGTPASASRYVRRRRREIEEMERILSSWVEDRTNEGSSLNFHTIKEKALSIYEDIKKKVKNPAEVPSFIASSGWFNGFKNRYAIPDVMPSSEAASVNEKVRIAEEDPDEVALAFPSVLKNLIDEEGYTLDQVFNLDETNLYWKQMPSSTFISMEEMHTSGFKAAYDRLTVMLGVNASGDLKLKPVVVYHSANPQALKGIVKSSLGAHFRFSKRCQMTGQIFTDLLSDIFQVVFEDYCKKKNLPFKILIILEATPSHPPTISELMPNIKILFLPPNSTSQLQPLNQGIVEGFRTYYLKQTFKMLIAASEGDNARTVLEFWKRFNIKHATDVIVEAWNDITTDFLHSAWHAVLPELIDFKKIGPSEELSKIKASCVTLAKEAGFEEVEIEDVEQLLKFHGDDLSTRDPQLISERQAEDAEVQQDSPRELSTSQLSSALSAIEKQLQWIEDNDYNAERSRITLCGVRSQLEPYKQLLYERRKMAKHQKLPKKTNKITEY